MDLDFSEEQEVMREMVRGVCDEYAPLETVRAMEDDAVGFPSELWKQMAELGLLGIAIPESYGGSEQGALDVAIVYEEFGRSLCPSPHFVSAILSAGILLEGGSEEQKKTWLPKIASGEAILTPAWLEPKGSDGPRGIQLRARADGDDIVLAGTKRHVLFASSASALLVLARSGDGDRDIDLYLVDPASAGVTLRQQQSLASDTQYEVTLRDVRVPVANRIGAAAQGWNLFESAMYDGIIALSAQAIGGAQAALDLTVQYAKDRHQFDKPLGAFQAVAHYLADAATAVDGGRTLVYEAAWARSENRPIERLAPMAKLFACQTFRDLTAMAQQVFGGVGFTIEYDIQLYFRRAKQLQLTWWGTRQLEERIAATVLDRESVSI